MIIGILLSLFLIVYFDVRLLKRADERIYRQYLAARKSVIAGFCALVVILVIFGAEKLRLVAVCVFIILLPYYLIKRRRYLKNLSQVSERFRLACDAFGVMLYWIFGGVVISVFVGAYFQLVLEFEAELGELLFSAIGSSLLLIYLVYRAASRFSSKGFLYNIALTSRGKPFWQLWLLPALIGFAFAAVSIFVVFTRDITPHTPLNEIISETQSAQILLLFILMAVGTAPLFEEIVFRGYFFHVLHRLKGSRFAIIVISLSFALLHTGQYWGDWLAIAIITAIGFGLTGLRAWSGSTVASTVTHYCYNAAVTVLPVVMLSVSNPAYYQYQMNFEGLDFGQKQALLREAIDNDPDLVDAYYELASLYLEERRHLEKALSAVDKALEYYPDDRIFLRQKALILEAMGRFKEALFIRQELMSKKRSSHKMEGL